MSSLSPLWVGIVVEAVAGSPLPDVGGWVLSLIGSVPLEPIAVGTVTIGFVGMSIKSVFDSILSDEEDDGGGGETGDDGLMPEEGGDDFGDLGGLEADGDEFGEFGDDEFGDMDAGADNDELEHRLDELETEVGSLSSTVNTVRNENEQISETVDDVEENVRKLLDIYEMVTRGVNPFADDIDAGGFGGPGDDSFGLFDQGEEEADDELEEDIVNADAEGFFDEDLVEDDEELAADADVSDVLGENDDGDDLEFDDEFDEDFGDVDDDLASDDGSDSGGEGGKSFAELKDEYESGDADWAEGEESDSASEDAFEDVDEDLTDGAEEDAIEAMDAEPAEDALADDDLFDTVIEDEDVVDDTTEVEDEDAVDAEEDSGVEGSGDVAADADDSADLEVTATEAATGTDEDPDELESPDDGSEPAAEAESTDETDALADEDDGKPYLTELPDGFLADLIVVEWLEFLVSEVGVRATAEAIHYYERIDWIDEDVADQLVAYLKGFEERGEPATLTIDHHTKSLRYVSQLDGGGAEAVALDQIPAMAGGGSDGIQR